MNLDVSYNLVNKEEMAIAIRSKADFELCREFTFWGIKESRTELQMIALELKNRRRGIALIELFFIGFLTNSFLVIVESIFGYRWLNFEDRPKDIIRQYTIGFSFISIFPFFYLFVCLANKRSPNLMVVLLSYGFFCLIGLVKTILDIINFVKLTRSNHQATM